MKYRSQVRDIIKTIFFVSIFLTVLGACRVHKNKKIAHNNSTTKIENKAVYFKRGYRFEKNGWLYLHVEGDPYDIGQQHGFLLANEIKDRLEHLRYLTYWETGMPFTFFVEQGVKYFASKIDQEYMRELEGIAVGAARAGVSVGWQDILALNACNELVNTWWPLQKKDQYAPGDYIEKTHCSAFIAVGSATKNGQIVVGHNSWDDFSTGQFLNVVFDICPTRGNHILMQGLPGNISSLSDFFITDAGIIGIETTLGGFSAFNMSGTPEFYRARKGMQYAKTLDQFVEIMLKNNNGGYANAWLLADLHANEIMRFELGLKYHNVERTKDGYFIGFNAAIDPRIRNLECSNTGYADIRRHQGSRQVRLAQLMKKYHGKIDIKIAKKILADHYDVYLKKTNPCSRTIDGHYELDDRKYISQVGRPLPFQPRGTVDGKVTDSIMAQQMSFVGRWGNSSGMPFNAQQFLDKHIQWDYLVGGYLKDRPRRPWTVFKAGEHPSV